MEYEKQKQVYVEDVISNGPGRVTHTLNISRVTKVRIHIKELMKKYDMGSKINHRINQHRMK